MIALGAVGDTDYACIALVTLLIGWEVRIFERFVLDGWYFQKGLWSHVLSPTGFLHFFTGFTLLYGYLNARTVEYQVSQ